MNGSNHNPVSAGFPSTRMRRNRKDAWNRRLIAENYLSVNDLIWPVFVHHKDVEREPVPSLPGVDRLSIDALVSDAGEAKNAGIPLIAIFPVINADLKSPRGEEALNPENLICRAVAAVKAAYPDLGVMTDVALDPYSSYGHDGIVENGKIVNDPTVEVLAEMALSHAQAGADIVAPSDMMDGRIGQIRNRLEKECFTDVGILSYSAKYASSFYGPFRDALDSAPGFGDKKTYQMDFANRWEALSESRRDVAEGADIVMVKPGMAYLDIIFALRQQLSLPIAAYQVSGEYAMLKAAAEKGWLNYEQVMMEQLIAFKRAGASLIASYHAKEACRLLRNE